MTMRGATLLVLLLLTACVNEAPPLMLDDADLYAPETEADAEVRLQAVARETGLWVFVITDTDPDPPRMLDEPMALADARGARAIALLVGPFGATGLGASRAATAAGEFDRLAALDISVGAGRASAAMLDALLTEVEAWIRDGRTPQPVVPGGEEVGPSGAP